MRPQVLEEATKLLADVRRARDLPLSERAAWALTHERALISCIQGLLDYHDGYRKGCEESDVKILRMASKLRAAIKPLFAARGTYRDYIEGTAPRLREAYRELSEFLGY